MKIFIWVNPYNVSYGTSMVFAVAETLAAARKEAAKACLYKYSTFKDDCKMDNIKLGKPDRVLNLPCAEWHEWSE